MGHPLLLQSAKIVRNFNSPELKQLLIDMKDTMEALDGVGLAAPQIAVSLRVMIFGVSKSERYPDMEPVPETVLINPELEILDSTRESDWEGCLSVPHMRGLVPRYKSIKYRGYDVNGQLIEREAHGFHARVFQHEFDHLNGILYPQRIENMKSFGFEDSLILEDHLQDVPLS
jgi:peptide deformylase